VTVGSLFSGIGGLELGLEACGLGPVLWQAECDPHPLATLAKQWPTVHRYKDVREVDGAAARVDVVCGGFPCQDISRAGTGHERRGLAGERSGLWREFARVIRVIRPRYVFVENVPDLVRRGLTAVLGDLATLGFDAEWDVFSSCAVGASHSRERLFLLAHANGDGEPARAVYAQVAVVSSAARPLRRPGRRAPSRGFRKSDGVPGGMDRLRSLGNAVDPEVAALAWRTLTARIKEKP